MNLHFKRARDCSGRGGLLSLPRVGEGWDFSLNSSPLPGEPNMLTAQTAVWEGLGQDQSYFAWVSNKWTVSVYIVSLQCVPPRPRLLTTADLAGLYSYHRKVFANSLHQTVPVHPVVLPFLYTNFTRQYQFTHFLPPSSSQNGASVATSIHCLTKQC